MNQVDDQALQAARTLLRRAEFAADDLMHQARKEGWEVYAEDLAEYLTLGVRPDPALVALLEGNLYQLLRHADLRLRRDAMDIAQALVEHAPRSACNGEIESWMEDIQEARKLVKDHPVSDDGDE